MDPNRALVPPTFVFIGPRRWTAAHARTHSYKLTCACSSRAHATDATRQRGLSGVLAREWRPATTAAFQRGASGPKARTKCARRPLLDARAGCGPATASGVDTASPLGARCALECHDICGGPCGSMYVWVGVSWQLAATARSHTCPVSPMNARAGRDQGRRGHCLDSGANKRRRYAPTRECISGPRQVAARIKCAPTAPIESRRQPGPSPREA